MSRLMLLLLLLLLLLRRCRLLMTSHRLQRLLRLRRLLLHWLANGRNVMFFRLTF
jgi:hypothetical protein